MDLRWMSPLVVSACVAGVLGCTADAPTPASTPPTTAPAAPAARPLPVGDQPVSLDAADFTADITNPFWPMAPGTRWTYREVDAEGAEKRVVVIATTETRPIANGLTARVVRDTVTEDGALVEDTFDWYAQDRAGNVWYLGEDTAEFEDDQVVTKEGSFEAGIDGAMPGIALPADPQPGMVYRQEFYRGHAEDNGEVLSVREQVDVPAGHYGDAMLTKDTATIEPDVLEYKLYARGVGPVLTLGISGGGGREELISVDTAPPGAGTGPLGRPDQ
jgi:hypothetical protein